MMFQRTVWSLALAGIITAFLVSGALAGPSGSSTPAAPIVVAQAATMAPAGSASGATLEERVTELEKTTVVLREDLGKARLDARTELDAAAKRQAESDAKLQKQIDQLSAKVADLNAQLAAEHKTQARRNRNLWIAIGILAVGIAVKD
jgi:TolA-binding protein